ncbi:MAG: carboxypeptidase regulatory-like domain-containing protein, partial [Candidatus Sericytochromatia bacterium]
MRTPQLGLLALLGLFVFSCAIPGGTDPTGASRKRPAPPEPTAKSSATPGPGATATPAPGGATPTPRPSAEPTEGPYFARVHNADDTPVFGATVRVYLDDGVAPIKGTSTDANGRFVLEGLAVWPVNLEVVGPISGKVYRRQVGEDTQKLTLTLAPTGRIAGKVTAPSLAAAPDFSDVTVRVLGTSYNTTAATDGAFVFESLPAGTFTLAAEGPLLGAATPDEVTVESAATAEADLVVAPTAPMIGSLTPAHGGPGSEVTIQGTAFGSEASGAASVTFGGVAAAAPQRVSTTEIRAVVPAN